MKIFIFDRFFFIFYIYFFLFWSRFWSVEYCVCRVLCCCLFMLLTWPNLFRPFNELVSCRKVIEGWRPERCLLAYKYVVEFHFAYFFVECLSPHSFHLSKVLAFKMISLIIWPFPFFHFWPVVIYLSLWVISPQAIQLVYKRLINKLV